MANTQTTTDAQASNAWHAGGSDRQASYDLQGAALILYLAGEQLDDPDPVRVSTWIGRLRAEGVV